MSKELFISIIGIGCATLCVVVTMIFHYFLLSKRLFKSDIRKKWIDIKTNAYVKLLNHMLEIRPYIPLNSSDFYPKIFENEVIFGAWNLEFAYIFVKTKIFLDNDAFRFCCIFHRYLELIDRIEITPKNGAKIWLDFENFIKKFEVCFNNFYKRGSMSFHGDLINLKDQILLYSNEEKELENTILWKELHIQSKT